MSDFPDARTLGRLATLCYLVAGSIVLFVVTDVIAVAWPFQPGVVSWRYGIIGLVSGTLYNPLVAVLVAFLGAALAGHRSALRIVFLVAALGSLVLLALLVVFALDVEQLRGLAQQGTQAGRFDRAGFQVFLKLLVGSSVFAVMGWLSLRQLGSGRRSAGRAARASEGPSIVSAREKP